MNEIVTGSWESLVVGLQAGEYIILPTKNLATKPAHSASKRKAPALKKTASRKINPKTFPPATPLAIPESNWRIAVRAAEAKQAREIRVLDLREVTSFTDTLIIGGGTSSRQNQTISDEIEDQLKDAGERAISIEGYSNGEWILLDYGDFVVNIFTEKARAYYDLERLWRDAKPLDLQVDLQAS